MLFNYHRKVMQEIEYRKIAVIDNQWKNTLYRGKKLGRVYFYQIPNNYAPCFMYDNYIEHNDEYLKECINNLSAKMNKEPWKYSNEDRERFSIISKEIEYNE